MTDDAFDFLPEEVLTGRAIPEEMLRDLVAIARLDARTVNCISEHLSNQHVLVDEFVLKDGLRTCLQTSDADVAESAVRALFNVEPADVPRIIKTIDQWRKSTDERRRIFTDDLFVSLERNLPLLAGDFPVVQLIRKANELLRVVGNEFREIAFFCDMRPVFDEPRESVAGFVMLANMRLLYVSQEGARHTCEVAFTEDELKKLIDAGKKALAKLNVLRTLSTRVTPTGNASSAQLSNPSINYEQNQL